MSNQPLKENLRSKYFTDSFNQKLSVGTALLRELRKMDVRVLRTDYNGMRPRIEIDPLTAAPVKEMQVSLMSEGTEPGGMRRYSKVIQGCEVIWNDAGGNS